MREARTISRTNDLKKLIQAQLKTVLTKVYYKHAEDDAPYPHIVYSLKTRPIEGGLHIYTLLIDIWGKDTESKQMDDYADTIEDMLDNKNLPQSTILPTFFSNGWDWVEDEDKSIQHILMTFEVQLYKRQEGDII